MDHDAFHSPSYTFGFGFIHAIDDVERKSDSVTNDHIAGLADVPLREKVVSTKTSYLRSGKEKSK